MSEALKQGIHSSMEEYGKVRYGDGDGDGDGVGDGGAGT